MLHTLDELANTGGQSVLPWVIGAAVVIVIAAALMILAAMRRRRAAGAAGVAAGEPAPESVPGTATSALYDPANPNAVPESGERDNPTRP